MCIEFDAKSKNNCQKNFCHRIQIIVLKKGKNIEKILHSEKLFNIDCIFKAISLVKYSKYSILQHN